MREKRAMGRMAGAERLRRLILLGTGLLWLLGNVALTVGGDRLRPGAVETWEVEQVSSGRTLLAVARSDPNRASQRVLPVGVDAPFPEQSPWGNEARAFWQQHLPRGKEVALEFDVDRTNAAGHVLAYVWKNSRLLNEEAIAEGYALARHFPPNVRYQKRLERAQLRARLLGLGIWNPKNPLRVSPSEFRRR
ncbi:MAG: thermonuclease family protein [Oscillatoriales cyanobacterium SM2_1_8]|nr:thermonuclease family protein [Oscillatoriales cyanobacterium SM2_1_8]